MLKKLKGEIRELHFPNKKDVRKDLVFSMITTAILTVFCWGVNAGMHELIGMFIK